MKLAEELYQAGYLSYPRTETDAFDPGMDLLVRPGGEGVGDGGWGSEGGEGTGARGQGPRGGGRGGGRQEGGLRGRGGRGRMEARLWQGPRCRSHTYE
jgi:hypothetical protein